jgi:hypothetical protein
MKVNIAARVVTSLATVAALAAVIGAGHKWW